MSHFSFSEADLYYFIIYSFKMLLTATPDLTFESLDAWKKSEKLKKSSSASHLTKDAHKTDVCNFPENDDDLNTQELDELDQIIVHEVKCCSHILPL